MAKFFDYIILFTASMILVFLITLSLLENISLALAISALAALLILITAIKISKRHKKYFTQEDLYHYFLKCGNVGVSKILSSVFSELGFSVKECENDLVLSRADADNVLISPCYKFSPTNSDDIVRIYRSATKHDCPAIYIVTKGIDRKAITMAETLKIKFKFISHKKIYEILKNKKLLPSVDEKLPRKKIKIKEILAHCFARRNAKFYLFSSIMLGLTSLVFSPFTMYYRIVACLNLVFTLLSLFDLGGKTYSKGLMEELNEKHKKHADKIDKDIEGEK